MTTNTKARPKAPAKPAAPKPPATPKSLDNVPETDAAPKPATRGGNSAYADEETRAKIKQAMKDLEAKGFTRPSISAVTGFTDSQVWRAHNERVHTVEVPVLMDFIEKVVKGEIKPPENSQRKPKAPELQARIDAALTRLAELDPKATVTALRKAVADVEAALKA